MQKSGNLIIRLFLIILLVGILDSCKEKDNNTGDPDPAPTPAKPENDWNKIADQAQVMTINAFWSPTAHYFTQDNQGNSTFHYWWNAHALDALCDAFSRTKENKYKTLMSELHDGIGVKNNNTYINDFYDDMEWMALASLRAYDLTKDVKYKNTAEILWSDIKTGWSDYLGGGIAWRKSQRNYKNTPANASAAILAARLYELNKDAADLEWARKIYIWQKNNLVDPATGQVWDGINRTGNNSIDKDWKFTYGHGVVIGAALELYKITNDNTFLTDALKTANYVRTDNQLSPNGLLKGEGGGDGGLFKGILIRYLTQLVLEGNLEATVKAEYIKFLTFNAETLWSIGTQKSTVLFGPVWNVAPTGKTESSTQLSGVMLMETMAKLKAAGLVK